MIWIVIILVTLFNRCDCISLDEPEILVKYMTGCSQTRELAIEYVKDPRKTIYIGPVRFFEWGSYYNFSYCFELTGSKDLRCFEGSSRNLLLQPRMLPAGEYSCTISYTHKKYKKTFVFDGWYLVVRPVAPTAIISGGTVVAVPPGRKIIINGKESVNYDLTNTNLRYKWFCKQSSSTSDFCSEEINQTLIEIPAKKVQVNEEFTVTLLVRSDDYSIGKAQQTIRIIKNAVILKIRCIKNCFPQVLVSNTKFKTEFHVSCEHDCEYIEDNNYKWTIMKSDQELSSVIGRRLVIIEDAIHSGDYVIRVNLVGLSDGRVGENQISITFETFDPKIEKCVTLPSEGITDNTPFKFYCEQNKTPEDAFFYEVYRGDATDGKILFSGRSPDVFEQEFFLESTDDHIYSIRISKINGSVDYQVPLETRVKREFRVKSRENITKMMEMHLISNKTFQELFWSDVLKERRAALQVLYIYFYENPNGDRQIYENYHIARMLRFFVLDYLLKYKERQISKFITKLDELLNGMFNNKTAEEQFDLIDLIEFNICDVLVRIFVDAVRNSDNILAQEEGVIHMAKILMKCYDRDKKPPLLYPSKIIPHYVKLVNPCIVREPTHYMNFLNNTNLLKLTDLQTLVYETINMTRFITSIISMTMTRDEQYVSTTLDSAYITINRGTGRNLPLNLIHNPRVTLILSEDLRDKKFRNYTFNIFIMSWKEDLMRLNNFGVKISTDIVQPEITNLQIHKDFEKFKSPNKLVLEINPDSKPVNAKVEEITIPKVYHILSNNMLNKYVNVHRIELFKHGTLRVQFYNVSDTDYFDVIVTCFKYPDADDFNKKNNITLVKKDNDFFLFKNPYNYMVWCYIAIMPNYEFHRNMRGLHLHYTISFQMSTCVKFNLQDNVWEQDCEERSSNNHQILCLCDEFSIIGGYVENVQAVQQRIIQSNTPLKIEVCNIIFMTVLSTYILYCIFVNVAIWKKKEPFYFLADNSVDDLYAYLVIVRTSNAFNSGTTSAVGIKITGERIVTEPHILNYPDPQFRLLQRFGEDTFVLTTPSYLGDIKQIELWHSCTGSSPTWFCRDILIYDLQEHREWYFNINKRFFIITGCTYIAVTPTEEGEKLTAGSIWSRLRVCGEFHSWYLFSSQEKFAYMKRITVVLSTMLTNYALSLIFHGAPKFQIQDCFDSYYSYTNNIMKCLSVGFTSSSISFTFHIAIAWIFRRSRIQFSRRKKQIAPCPYGVTITCWMLVMCNIVVCTSYLLIYGFWVPKIKSWIWLTSSVMGIAYEIFIYDNLIVLVHSLFSKIKLEVDIAHKTDVIIKTIEKQRQILFRKYGPELFRPHLMHLYKPLKNEQIEEKKLVVRHRSKIQTQIWDMLGFVVYFILLNLMISTTRNPNTLESKNTLMDMMDGKFTRTIAFSDITTIEDIYTFIEETLIPSLHPHYWYYDKKILSKGLMIDMTNKCLGVVRIRQHRLKPNQCKVDKKLAFLFKNCYPEFHTQYEENRTFGYSWTDYSKNSYIQYDHYKDIWRYRKRTSHDVYGQFTWYPGGGYMSTLGTDRLTSMLSYRDFHKKRWIDPKTRSIIIEFLTYSANSNMFNAVSMVYEQSATGYTSKRVKSQAARMLMNDNEQEYKTTIIFYTYHVWVVVLAIKHGIRILFGLKTFFKDVWFLLDLSITILNVATLLLQAARQSSIGALTHELEEVHHSKFIFYFQIFQYEEYVIMTTAFVLTFATLRLWQFLRFGLIFRIMERTLTIACVPLLAATFAFFIILMAFGLSGMILIGNEFSDFYTLLDICRTLITMSLKPDQFDIRTFLILKITYPYFSVYLILMQIIIFVYIIIIIMAYMKAQIEFSVGEEPYTIKHYLQEQMKLIPLLFKAHFSRIIGGDHKSRKVFPKADEFRYANCVQIQVSSIRKMKLLTKGILRKIRKSGQEISQLSLNDKTLMMQISYYFFLGKSEEDEKDLFFKGHFAGKQITLIDEKRIMIIESVVHALLHKPHHRKSMATRRNSMHMQGCSFIIKKSVQSLKNIDLRLRLIILKCEEYGL